MNQKIRCTALWLLCSLLPSVRIAAITTLPRFILCPLASPESSIVSVLPLVFGNNADSGSGEASPTQASSVTGVKSRIAGEQGGRG